MRKDEDATEMQVNKRTDQLKGSKERLRETAALNEAMLKAIPFPMDIVDEKGNLLFISERMGALVGKDISGKKCWELYRDDKRQCVDCPLLHGIKIGEVATIETSGLFGGKRYQISHIGMVYQDKKAILEIFQDITERKRLEEAVRESRDYLDSVINSVTDPIFVKDRQHRWVLLNDAFCNFMGYDRKMLLGKTDSDFFPKIEADAAWQSDEIVFKTKEEKVNEEEVTDAKGVTHTVIVKKTLYIDAKKDRYIVGIIRDVTELKRLESL